MKTFNLIFIIFFSTTLFSQKYYHKLYFENENLKEEGWFNNNQKVDFWYHYYSNGNVKKKGHYNADEKQKYWSFYHSNGMIESEGHYKNNLKDSWWIFYNKAGVILQKYQLINGIKNGYHFYYNNNEIVKAEKYKSGKKTGEWTDIKTFKKENKFNSFL
jgi:antitoxin component YwqK of YwqJK toxin-antitoxin module